MCWLKPASCRNEKNEKNWLILLTKCKKMLLTEKNSNSNDKYIFLSLM